MVPLAEILNTTPDVLPEDLWLEWMDKRDCPN
jgi:hypothetical protein